MIKHSKFHLLFLSLLFIVFIGKADAQTTDSPKLDLVHKFSKCDEKGCQIKGTVGTYTRELSCLVRNKDSQKKDLHEKALMSPRIIIYGPPGTGKTNLVEKLAIEENAIIVKITNTELITQFQGKGTFELEVKVNSLKQDLSKIENKGKRGFLVFDELDSFAGKNETEMLKSHNDVKQKLCLLSDELRKEKNNDIVIIGITNRHEFLDGVFTSRFGSNQIEIEQTNKTNRAIAIEYFIENKNSKLDEESKITSQDKQYIIKHTSQFNLRQIEDLVTDIYLAKQKSQYFTGTLEAKIKAIQGSINDDNNLEKTKTNDKTRETRHDMKEEDMTRLQGAILGGSIGAGIAVVTGINKTTSGLTYLISQPIPSFVVIGTCAFLGQYLLHYRYYGSKKKKQ